LAPRTPWLGLLLASSCFDDQRIEDSRDIASDDLILFASSLGTAQGTEVTVYLGARVPTRGMLKLRAPEDTLLLDHGSSTTAFLSGPSVYTASISDQNGPFLVRLERQQDRSLSQLLQPPPPFELTSRMTVDGGEDALDVQWTNAQPGYAVVLTLEGPCLTRPLSGALVTDTGSRQIRRSEMNFNYNPQGCELRITLRRTQGDSIAERQTSQLWGAP
jgi:hypothetical protein